METKQHNIIIIGASLLIAATIWVVTMRTHVHAPQRIEGRVFKVMNGWGYDILVNDTIMIHQESIPVMQHRQPFVNREQAEKTAYAVIQKIKKGQHPSLTKFDLDKILGSNGTNDNRQRNLE